MKDGLGGAFDTLSMKKIHAEFWWVNMKVRDDLDVGGGLILKRISTG
jgi:hypothetical protein